METAPSPSIAAASQQCVFCQIIEGRIPSHKVFEDDLVVAILDIHPAVPGHVLLLPKKHAVIMPQVPPDALARLGILSKRVSRALLKAFPCEGTTIFIANGAAAGQKTPHFMVHVIPRQQSDGLTLQLTEQEVQGDFLTKLKQKLTGEPASQESKGSKKEAGTKEKTPGKKKVDDEDSGKKDADEKNPDDQDEEDEDAGEGDSEDEDGAGKEGGKTGDGLDLGLIDRLFG